MKKKRKQEEIKKKTNKTIDFDEIKQIEEWSGMEIGNIIFDSDVDGWKVNTSVFGQKVLNKSNLIFVIEDDDNNLFGGCINPSIVKYDINNPQNSFVVDTQRSNSYLFLIGCNGGCDIRIYKENNKTLSQCNQQSLYNYNGIQSTLCGKSYPNTSTPKRITLIQLI